MTSVFDRLSKTETASSKRKKGGGKSEGDLDDVLGDGKGENRSKPKGSVNSAVFDRLTKAETASTAKKRVSTMKVSQSRERNKNNSSSSRFVVSMRISPIIESAEAVPSGRRSPASNNSEATDNREEATTRRRQKASASSPSDRRDFFERLASTETASSASFKNSSGDQKVQPKGDQKVQPKADPTTRSAAISTQRQAFYDRLMNAETQQSARFKKATNASQKTPSSTSPKKPGTISQKQQAIIDRLASTETKSSRQKGSVPKTQAGKSEKSGTGVSSSKERVTKKADALFDRLASHETASFRARKLAAKNSDVKPATVSNATKRSPARPVPKKSPKAASRPEPSPVEVKNQVEDIMEEKTEVVVEEHEKDPADIVSDGDVIPSVQPSEIDDSLDNILAPGGHSVKLYITDARLSGTEDSGSSDEEEKKSNGFASFRALSPTELGLDDTLASYEKGKLTSRHVANYIVDALFMKDFLGNNTSDNWEIKDPVAKELVHTEGGEDLTSSPLMKDAYSTWAVEKLAQRNHSDVRSVATGKALIHFPWPGETDDGDVLKIENYSYDVSVP